MKYYSSTLLHGSMDILGSYPLITEIVVPLLSSRDDALKKFAEKKGFVIEHQMLLDKVPPLIRTLRRVESSTTLLNVTALDTQMKGYVKSLRSLGLMPERLYSAVIVPNAQEVVIRVRNQGLYILPQCSIETIFQVHAPGFKEVLAMGFNKSLIFDQTYLYKNKSDPDNVYRVNGRIGFNVYSPEPGLRRLQDINDTLRGDVFLRGFQREQRIEILNRSII